MSLFFFNTDGKSISGESRHRVLIDKGLAVTGGPNGYGALLGLLAPNDTLLMYANGLGVVAIGTVRKLWDGKAHRKPVYYRPGIDTFEPPNEYRINVDWRHDLSEHPISAGELKQRIAYHPRKAIERIEKWQTEVETMIAERVGTGGSRYPAYLLLWNPSRYPFRSLPKFIRKTSEGNIIEYSWSTGNRKNFELNARAYLVRVDSDRGIVGSGYISGESFIGPSWDDDGDKKANYVEIVWDIFTAVTDRLPLEQLIAADLDIHWERLQSSGIQVPQKSVKKLEHQWQQHLRGIGLELLFPEIPSQRTYWEGATTLEIVNVYERNPRARRECLQHHGYICKVCKFNFAKRYGEIGEDFIHVHHVKDLASIGKEYRVDPISDLVPVCPNCHAMLHTQQPALSIDALKSIIAKQKGTNSS